MIGRGSSVTGTATRAEGAASGPPDNRARARRAAAGHSRRVRLLRIALPVLAAVIVVGFGAVTLVRSFAPGLDISALRLSSDGIVMEKPRLSGHGPDRSYEITAARAVQSLTETDRIDLEKIKAVITMSDGRVVDVSARSGIFNNKKELLTLEHDIVISSSAGDSGSLSSAVIDLKTGNMTTDRPVDLGSKTFAIQAGAATSANNGNMLTFSKGVKVTITPASPAPSASGSSNPSPQVPAADTQSPESRP